MVSAARSSIIMLTAVICGATSYAKVEMFGESKEKRLDLHGIVIIFCEIEEKGKKKSKQAHYFIYSCKGMTAAQILVQMPWRFPSGLVLPLHFC